MIREIDLVSYLPPFMAGFKEIVITLEAENPEFLLVWRAADQVLKNEFIEMADEYGISRFEKMLGILPSREDTLESRRARVRSQWINVLPYTVRMLLQKLQIVCGSTDFVLKNDFEKGYTLLLYTNLEQFGSVEEVENILGTMVPCNIRTVSRNRIGAYAGGYCYFTGVVSFAEIVTISD